MACMAVAGQIYFNESDSADWSKVAQERVQWPCLVNTVINLRVS
jgi:hypothetical protein